VKRAGWFTLPLLLFGSTAVAAATISGRTLQVIDGDTLRLQSHDGHIHRIRLSGIDAPELGQPYGEEAKRHLEALSLGQTLKAECYKRDRHRRQVCRVSLGGRDLALAQLQAGLAWWFTRYAAEQAEGERLAYAAAERRAAQAGLGLWRQPAPTPPWQWRRSKAPALPATPPE